MLKILLSLLIFITWRSTATMLHKSSNIMLPTSDTFRSQITQAAVRQEPVVCRYLHGSIGLANSVTPATSPWNISKTTHQHSIGSRTSSALRVLTSLRTLTTKGSLVL